MNRKKINITLFGIVILLLILSESIGFQISNIELLLNPRLVTPASPLYYIKTSREYLQSKFIFGDEDLATWYFNLATKRITEAEILSTHNLKTYSNNQLNLAQNYQEKGYSHLKPLIDVIDTNLLQEKYQANQRRIEKLRNLNTK